MPGKDSSHSINVSCRRVGWTLVWYNRALYVPPIQARVGTSLLLIERALHADINGKFRGFL